MFDLTVWLSYVAYPVTTAVYLERAFRRVCRTVTVGPRFPERLVAFWELENLRRPFVDLDVPTDFTPEMPALLQETRTTDHPDLYLWVESVAGHFPRHISALPCRTAAFLIDTHLHARAHLEWAREFDMVFLAQRQFVEPFRAAGVQAHWLPLACDPEVHHGGGLKRYDIGFVGSVTRATRRERLLKRLRRRIDVHISRCFWDEMATVLAASRMAFNCSRADDLNMRFFEVLSIGSLLLSNRTRGSGQDQLFTPGEDYAGYTDRQLTEQASRYLADPDLREKIAARGQKLAHAAHTYNHRVEDVLRVMMDQKSTTWSAHELRERSLSGLIPRG
jgi:hypothetical protein